MAELGAGDDAVKADLLARMAELESELRTARANERQHERRQRLLHAVVGCADALSRCTSLDELCRQAVELARDQLGAERCSIYLMDGEQARGTFGTNRDGRTTDERGCALDDAVWVAQLAKGHLAQPRFHRTTKKLVERVGGLAVEVTEGWHCGTPITGPDRVVGLFCNDAAITGAAFDPILQDVLVIYCSVLGGLIIRQQATDQLAEREARYRELIRLANGFFYINDWSANTYHYLDPSIARVLKVDPERFSPDDLRAMIANGQFYPAHDGPTYDGETYRLQPEGTEVFWADLLINLPEGGQRWLTDFAIRERNEAGQIVATHGLFQDITARKEVEERLRTSEAMFRAITENTNDLTSIIDADGLCRYITPAVELVLGHAPAQLVGRSPLELCHPDDQTILATALTEARAIPGETVTAPYYRVRHRSGEYRVMSTRLTNLLDAPSVAGLVLNSRDVTERVRAERQLRESEARFAAIFQATPAAVIIMRREGGELLLLNDAAAHALGKPREELIGRSIRGMDLVDRETRERIMVTIGRDGYYRDLEVPIRVGSGEERLFMLSGAPVELAGEECLLHVAIDLTERRELEQRLSLSERLESLGVLAGGIAHDFNNLLTGVLGNAGLVRMELPLDSPWREPLTEIELAARQAAELTRQMLAYAGKGKLRSEPEDLNALAYEIGHLVRPSVSRKVDLAYHLGAALPPVVGDRGQLSQVLMNLMMNACEAIGDQPGQVTVTTASITLADSPANLLPEPLPPGPYVRLAVTDTGSGITDEVVTRMFEPFYTTKFTGRGLGLSAVIGILRSHHGGLTVSSRPGEGTTMTVYLPAGEGTASAAPAAVGDPATTALRGRCVLVVDDEEAVRLLAERGLQHYGADTFGAASGEDAIELLASGAAVDLVLLDLTMAGLSGAEALHQIRQLWPTLPVILSSGFTAREVRQQVGELAYSAFLQKPYGIQELARVVGAVLSGTAAVTPGADHNLTEI